MIIFTLYDFNGGIMASLNVTQENVNAYLCL